MLIKKSDFNEVGGFDEIYVTSSEDVDLCFKVRFKQGKEIWMAADSILYHYTDVTGATSQNVERTHPILLERWKDKLIRDEEDIYEADGFSPELMRQIREKGIAGNFGQARMLMEILNIQTVQRQREYVKSRGRQGFDRDLETIFKQAPGYDLTKQMNAVVSRQGTSGNLNGMDRFLIQRVIRDLTDESPGAEEKQKIYERLNGKLNAVHFFTYMYNLASVLKENGEPVQANRLFTFLAKYLETADPRLAAKAYYKLSELTGKTKKKIAYLRRSQTLMPEHKQARAALRKLEEYKTLKILRSLNDIPGDWPVYLYGSGQAGRNFLKILREYRPDIKLKHFLDTYVQGYVDTLPVNSPVFFEDEIKRREELVLIVSVKWREIEEILKRMGISDYLIVPPRFLVPSGFRNLSANPSIDPRVNTLSHDLFSPEDREQRREQLEAVEALLERPEDRRLYRILTGRTENNQSRLDALAQWYYNTALKGQYFDTIDYSKVKTVIEGGVADGADTKAFIEAMSAGGRVYGFEPNIDDYNKGPHYKRLSENPAVKILPKGLWSHSGRLYFRAAGLSSSFTDSEPGDSADPEAWEKVEVAAIDDYIKAEGIEKVDLIKLDIEGAELEALKGAAETLKKHRPQVAVCLYHRKEHFYQIPQYLDSILPGYRYRLGHYTAGSLETVWYAVPKS